MIKNKRILMGGCLLGLFLVGFLQVWAYPIVTSDQPSDAELLRNMLLSPECVQACHLGIEPSKTSIEDALAILTQHGIVYEENWINGVYYDYYWDIGEFAFYNPSRRFNMWYNHQTQLVETIYYPIAASQSLIIEAFG